ncbi:MAG: hypothetical protein ACRCTI_02120, partial [Beijerinckiaceae bacterium]
MFAALWTWETAVGAAALAAAALWAARPVQRWRIEAKLRAFREDVWRAMVPTRDGEIYLDILDRYEFDEGSDTHGVMVFKNGIRL